MKLTAAEERALQVFNTAFGLARSCGETMVREFQVTVRNVEVSTIDSLIAKGHIQRVVRDIRSPLLGKVNFLQPAGGAAPLPRLDIKRTDVPSRVKRPLGGRRG